MSDSSHHYSVIAQKEAEIQYLREENARLKSENDDFKQLATELYSLKELILEAKDG